MWWLLAPFRYLVLAPLRLLKTILFYGIIVMALVGAYMIGTAHADAAQLTTDSSTYVSPATVGFSNFVSGDYLDVYLPTGTPVCELVYSGGNSGILETVCSGFGTYDGTVAGSYALVSAQAAACTTLTLAQCKAVNPGMPGIHEADFDITSGGGGGGGGSVEDNTIPIAWILSAFPVAATFLFFIKMAKPTEVYLASMKPSKLLQRMTGRSLRGKWYD